MINLDFLWVLNSYINSLGLFARSNVGNLMESDSIAIQALPGGITQKFYNGMRDQDYNISFTVKSKKQQDCITTLNTIHYNLLALGALPSVNGSYIYDRFVVDSQPNFILKDEQGYFIYELSTIAKITINRGVV